MTLTDPRPVTRVVIEPARRHARRRRRRLVVLVTVTMAAVGTIAVVAWVVPGGPRQRSMPVPAAAAPLPMPARVVAWTDRFRVVVLSSSTGRVVRTLAQDVALIKGLPTVSVALDGTVFYDSFGHQNGRPVDVIRRVSTAGGKSSPVTVGDDPVVSPDGRTLAYVVGRNDQRVETMTLRSGRRHIWEPREALASGAISWSPDSKRLSVTLDSARALMLQVTGSGRLGQPRPIRVPAGSAWAGFLTPTSGLAVTATGSRTRIQTVDPLDGDVTETLVVPGPLFTGNTQDGPEASITATGQHYLLIATTNPAGQGQLYRWATGQRSPTLLAHRIVRAAWIPVNPR